MATYKTREGDSLDFICWKHYEGQQSGAVEVVLEANPGLAKHGPILPQGLTITLPELPREAEEPMIKLWE